jgi:hypothetical protein
MGTPNSWEYCKYIPPNWIVETCCDMTAESRNSGAGADVQMLSNGSEITFPPQWIARNESLPGSKFLTQDSRDNQQNNRGQLTFRHGNLYSGRVAEIKGVHSWIQFSQRLVRKRIQKTVK